MVLICDLDGTISYASPLRRRVQLSARDAHRRPLSDFVHPEDIGAAQATIAIVIGLPEDAALALGTTPESLAEAAAGRRTAAGSPAGSGPPTAPGGHIESVLLYRLPGEPARMLLTIRDVSDQVALRQQVTHLTFHDGVTGLPNRAYFEERTREVLERPRRAGWPASSSWTSTASPRSTTRSATARATSCWPRRPGGCGPIVRADDTLARWGGDEFAVLLENAADAAGGQSTWPSGWSGRVSQRAVPGRRPGHRADRQRRRGLRRRQRVRRGAAQRRRGDGPGQGLRRRPGRGVRRAHARGRGAPPGHGQRPAAGAAREAVRDEYQPVVGPGHVPGHRRRGAGPLVARRRGGSAASSSSRSPRTPG